jgi:hypothetical protein
MQMRLPLGNPVNTMSITVACGQKMEIKSVQINDVVRLKH